MPQTSLSQQLKRLAAPQTSQLVDKTSKPSLLFDFKEAANIGRDTFYSIGLSGLEELEAVNPIFKRYERTLFDYSSVNFVRSIESTGKNKKLDEEISRFIFHCSPYFLLNPTHKALEWLINRFQIQDYNTDSLMMLALPYYGTTTFAQVVQLLNLNVSVSWAWLRPIKREGTPLSVTALLNRAATDMSFFKFVCNMPLLATKVCQGKEGNCLASLFTFYCTTIIGALQHTYTISDLHVSNLLPSIMSGLSSEVDDYIASSYMILSCLAAKVQLSSTVLQSLFTKIIQVRSECMRTEAVLLMVILCQCNSAISEKSLELLIKAEWFIPCFTKAADSGVVVFPLITDMMTVCIEVIDAKKEILTEVKQLVINVLEKVHFSDDEVEQIFRLFIDACSGKKRKATLNWTVQLLQSLEKRYPESFDIVISDSKYSVIAKQIMGLRDDYQGQSDLFERLHHPNPKIRTLAVVAVPHQLEPVQSSWLSETILERLSDDSPDVVMAAIGLPIDYLQSLIGRNDLVSCLTNLAGKIWFKKKFRWLKAASKIFVLLGELLSSDFDELTLLKTTIPFLFVSQSQLSPAAVAILSSKLPNFSCLLKAIREKVKKKTLTNSELCKAMWVSLHDPFSFSLQVDENAIKCCHSESSIFKFVTILFASAALPSKSDPSHSVKLVLLIDNLVKESELVFVKPLELNVKTLSGIASFCQREKLPVQVIQHFLSSVINKTDIKLDKINCWWDMSDASQIFLYNVFKTSLDILDACNDEYFAEFFDKITSELKQKTHFVKPEDYCKLLCNIIVKSPDIALQCLDEIKCCLQKQQGNEIAWTVELSQNNVIVPTLLIGLSSNRKEVRQLVFDVMNYINSNLPDFESPYLKFIKELLLWEEEISCDSEQMYVATYMILSPDPAVQSGHPKVLQHEMIKVCKTLFSVTVDEATPPHIVASLLQLLVYVNSVDIMKTLIPLAVKILNQDITEDQKIIVDCVIKKIEPSVVSVFEDDETWTLAEKCLKLHDTRILIGSDQKPPAVLFLKMISEQVFAGLSEKGKFKLLDLAVAMNANSENGEANIAVMGMVKRIVVDASFVLPLLLSMKDVKVTLPENTQKRRKSWHRPPILEILRTVDWKKGLSLLELIQNKKKINNVQVLLPTLFDILKRCLEFAEQSPVEYTKQLSLSTILHFCQKLSEEGKLVEVPKQIFQVELIVQCIRESQNPQTHQHALLVLVEVAALVPDKVLHDIMPIFTFVGSSVLRMDDSYSFQIILKIIEAVVPILVKSIKGTEDSLSVQQVLQVFVDALLDIPEHRRFTLLLKLITTLDSDGSYLWLFICLIAQSEILSSNPSKPQSENVTKSYEKGKLKILKDLCLEFPAVVLIRTMYHVIKHVASLPHDKDGKSGFKKRNSAGSSSSIFDFEKNTGKQLRHYKYILINFISSFLATPSFIDMILVHNNNDADENLVTNFKLLVHEVLDYLQAVSIQVNKTVNQPSSKYWKAMQHVVEDIHGKVNAILPNSIFLNMMRSILSVNCPAKIQRKMMEILNWRLQSTALDEDGLVSLVPVILSIIQNDISSSIDAQIAQQAAFITLKLLARQAATSHPSEFVKALACVTDVVEKGLKEDSGESNDAVLASAVLCLAEMVATLGSKAIQFLPKFMPAIIQTVSRARSDPDVPEVLLLSVVATVQKVLEHHTYFINPYLDRIFTELCMISSVFHEKNSSQKSNVNSKLDAIRKTLAEKLELRVLLPAVESSYYLLMEQQEYGAISYLMSLLSDSLIGMYDLKDLQKFLIKALNFRSDIGDPDATNIVEPAVISCTVSMVLKMNEQQFKSFYSTLIKRMIVMNYIKAPVKELFKYKAISFYNLCGSLAETLKSIFVPYAKDFLLNAADILNSCNTGKLVGNRRLFFKDKDTGTQDSEEMVKSILNAFLAIFRYDADQFITEDRFNIIMKPLVDQLENDFCTRDDTLENLLAPCLALMATSINDDTLWKKYNYEILLKTQHKDVKVRLAAVKTICEVAKKLGDSYLPLLPETIPFLSELLEDEDEGVEKTCRSVVQDLESVLGEEISKFF